MTPCPKPTKQDEKKRRRASQRLQRREIVRLEEPECLDLGDAGFADETGFPENPQILREKEAQGSGRSFRHSRKQSGADFVPTCWLCGRNGCGDPLDKHHVFGGSYRKKSEAYGAVVFLCHGRCHENGRSAAHRNAETSRRLHEEFQRKIMDEQGWTTEEFIWEFGRNYL